MTGRATTKDLKGSNITGMQVIAVSVQRRELHLQREAEPETVATCTNFGYICHLLCWPRCNVRQFLSLVDSIIATLLATYPLHGPKGNERWPREAVKCLKAQSCQGCVAQSAPRRTGGAVVGRCVSLGRNIWQLSPSN